MKTLNTFITEKILINKQTNIGFDPDNLECDDKFYENAILYNSENNEDEDEDATEYEDFEHLMWETNDLNEGFIVTKFESLSKTKNIEKVIKDCSDNLPKLIENIITGKDLGYEVRSVNGHLEIDCINSGSRGTYYIYALSQKGYQDINNWFYGNSWGDEDNIDIKTLINDKNIRAIIFP